jgi:chromosome segregation ATPase
MATKEEIELENLKNEFITFYNNKYTGNSITSLEIQLQEDRDNVFKKYDMKYLNTFYKNKPEPKYNSVYEMLEAYHTAVTPSNNWSKVKDDPPYDKLEKVARNPFRSVRMAIIQDKVIEYYKRLAETAQAELAKSSDNEDTLRLALVRKTNTYDNNILIKNQELTNVRAQLAALQKVIQTPPTINASQAPAPAGAEAARLQAQLADSQAQLATLQARLAALEAQLAEAEADAIPSSPPAESQVPSQVALQQAQAELEKVKEDLRKAQEELAQVKAELAEVRAEKPVASEEEPPATPPATVQNNNEIRRANEKEDFIASLEKKLDQETKDKEELRKLYDDILNELEKCNKELAEFKSQVIKLKEENISIKEQLQECETREQEREQEQKQTHAQIQKQKQVKDDSNDKLVQIIKTYMSVNTPNDADKASFLDSLTKKIPDQKRGGKSNTSDLYSILKNSLESKSTAQKQMMLYYIENKVRATK